MCLFQSKLENIFGYPRDLGLTLLLEPDHDETMKFFLCLQYFDELLIVIALIQKGHDVSHLLGKLAEHQLTDTKCQDKRPNDIF